MDFTITFLTCRFYSRNTYKNNLTAGNSSLISKLLNLHNFNIFNRPYAITCRTKGRVFIAVLTDIYAEEVPLQQDIQAIAVCIFNPRPLTICSIYLPPNETISREQITNPILSLKTPFTIMGDFNAYYQSWGSQSHNSKGKILASVLQQFHLSILNSAIPMFYSHAHQTWKTLDLIIASPSLSSSLHPIFIRI